PKEYYVLGSKELSDGILGFFSATRMIMFVMVIVAFGVSVFGILNTMLMAVMERRREMAYLKCVGAKKRDILGLVTLESLILCSAGAIAGAGIGLALMPAADHLLRGLLIAYIPAGSITDPTLPLISLSILLTVAVGVLCALYPAWKAASIVPMEVLRNE
nr:FtsX-like permease family protein [Spirochaetota bacterium]